MIPGSFTELQFGQCIFGFQRGLLTSPHSYPASSLEREKGHKLSRVFSTIICLF